ncbi:MULTISPECIES: helix-turn-helix domain-containing protein [unclassified Enterococcus]|uniref:helix-turn-helix domain-containing protein n=1 Tax=unclassified Enterococcus TaxID=2608891 RepID=UPI0013ECBD5B|nr:MULTISPECIES: helix-turn-helix domain-containing protein [unclassified Enterococcus]
MLIDAKKKELLVLYAITQKNDCSLQKLSDELAIPKRTIKELIRKLNLSITHLFGIESFIYSTPKGEIKLNDLYHENRRMIFCQLKLHYLKESNRFNYLLLLIDSPHAGVSKDYLAKQLYLSTSYLEKLTQQINKILKKYQLQITSSQNRYFLEGNELSIRIYLYLFLTDAFQGLEWPFTTICISQLKKQYQLSSAFLLTDQSEKQLESIYLLLALFTIRLDQHSLIPPASTEIMEVLCLLQKVQDFSGTFKQRISTFLSELDGSMKQPTPIF